MKVQQGNRQAASRVRVAHASSHRAMQLMLSGMLVCAAAWTAPADAKEPAAAKSGLVTTSPDDAHLQWGPCPPIFAKGCEVTVLSGNPAKGRADVYLRTPANFDLPDHVHHSTEHVVLVRGKFSVTFEGNRRAEVAPGAYTLIPGGTAHSARCEDGGSCVIFIAFDKPVDAMLAPKRHVSR